MIPRGFMAPRLRKMRTYHPRRRSNQIELQKQELHDIKHKMSSGINRLLVLMNEGSSAQIPMAQQKAKSDFAKHADDMNKLAQKMGERYAKAVREYLDSVESIVLCNLTSIDEEKIGHCFHMSEKLEKEISAA
jgi:hypothetical protein